MPPARRRLRRGEPAEDLILRDLGEAVGLLFQIRDDILDVEGSASSLGKTPGKDAAASKLTYPALHGLDRSRARLKELGQEAMAGSRLCRASARAGSR